MAGKEPMTDDYDEAVYSGISISDPTLPPVVHRDDQGEFSTQAMRRLTWKEAYEREKERADKLGVAAQILSDLDRCEHGRHETDDCFGCKDDPVYSARGTQWSKGNLFIRPDRRIGSTLGGKPIVMPTEDRHDFTNWLPK